MSPSFEQILGASLESLAIGANQLDTEQAVQGLDALTELQLHELIELGFTNTGLGIHREAHYPSTGDAYTKSTHRPRCDFALTLHPGLKLLDPASELKQLALAQDTLFAGIPQPEPDPDATCTPEDAWWIEVKTCAQYAYRDGIPAPNPSYAHQLVTGLQTDLCKLAGDPRIWHACSLVILFAETETIARHDLHQAAQICMAQDLPVRSPLIGCQSITDRAGNACVAVGLFSISI